MTRKPSVSESATSAASSGPRLVATGSGSHSPT